MQILGANGYTKEYPLVQRYGAVRGLLIGGGS
ncbi:MAG: acyl-CoA dehydrogenase family protein, partial [Sphaerochaetaceae bacterium]